MKNIKTYLNKKCFLCYSWEDVLVVGVSAVAFLFLLFQNTLIANDDLIYRFDQRGFGGNEQLMTTITSWTQLFASNNAGYLYGNGRYLVHCIIQMILGFRYEWILYVFSPLLFTCMMFSCIFLIRTKTSKIKGDVIYLEGLLFTLVPLCASTCYGPVIMMINYMWSAAVYCTFLAIYMYISMHTIQLNYWAKIGLLIFGLVCGSWQESFCIGIAGALAIYHLIHIRQFKGNITWLVIGFGIGACVLILAPGNFVRAGNADTGFVGVSSFVYQCVQLFKHNLFVWLWLAIGVVSAVIDYIKSKKVIFVVDNWLWFSCSAIALAFTLYTLSKGMMQGMWQLMVLGLTDSILFIRFFSHYYSDWMNSKYKYIIGVTSVYLVVLLSTVFYFRTIVKHKKDAFDIAFVIEKPDTIYDGRLQYMLMEEIPTHPFLFEKICPIDWNFYSLITFQRMARYYTNAQETWGTELLPEPKDSIIACCIEENRIGNSVYRAPLGYLIVKCPKEAEAQLYVHTTCKFPIDKFKDKLKRRDVRDIAYSVSRLKKIDETEEDDYYVRYVDWWTYNSKNIVGADIEIQNIED